MAELRNRRPFQQRFLDGYDRSQLRQEVEKVKPKRFSKLRHKYATWALGASLALGGMGVPMKMLHDSHASKSGQNDAQTTAAGNVPDQIQNDLQDAQSIAKQVAGGVQAAASGVESVTTSPLATVAEAPQKIVSAAGAVTDAVKDTVKEHFFRTEVPFGQLIYSEAKKNGLSPELVAAVAHTESKVQPAARSGAGAIGLMQLVPRTGRWMGAQDLTNPAQNVMAGAKYLKYLTDRFGGDEQKAIAAYNAGEGNVRRFNGVPPFRETRAYVQRVRNFQRDLGDRIDGRAVDAAASQVAALH